MTPCRRLTLAILLASLAAPQPSHALDVLPPIPSLTGASASRLLHDPRVVRSLRPHLMAGELAEARRIARESERPPNYARSAEREEGADDAAPLYAGGCLGETCQIAQVKVAVMLDGRAWLLLVREDRQVLRGPSPPEAVARVLEAYPGC